MGALFPFAQAILIDLDGTLVDSASDIAAAANRMLAGLGAPPLPGDTVRGFIGNGVPTLVRRVLAASPQLPDPDQDRALAAFYRHYSDCNGRHGAPYPGVLQGLSTLHRLGYRLACVTNKPQVHTLPLHRQVIPWAARSNVGVVHRPDNWFEVAWVTIGK